MERNSISIFMIKNILLDKFILNLTTKNGDRGVAESFSDIGSVSRQQ